MRAIVSYTPLPPFRVEEPVIAARIARTWLVLGALALACLPPLRERSDWLGWLPFWLVIVPAAQLAILRARRMLADRVRAISPRREYSEH